MKSKLTKESDHKSGDSEKPNNESEVLYSSADIKLHIANDFELALFNHIISVNRQEKEEKFRQEIRKACEDFLQEMKKIDDEKK